MMKSLAPSFDALLRRYLGRQLRVDGFKLVRSRTYEREVGNWMQRVYVQRFTRGLGFVMQVTMASRDIPGCLTERYSEHGRNVIWGDSWRIDAVTAHSDAARAYCERIRPLLNNLVSAASPLDTVSPREFAALGAYVGPFHRGWMQLEWFANLRWRDGRLHEARQFAQCVVEESYLMEHHKARARSIIAQIDSGMPYSPDHANASIEAG